MEAAPNLMSSVLLGLSIILIAAKIGALIANRFKQPEVLGELVAGIVIGNFFAAQFIGENLVLAILGELGVIILLFEVGLESNLAEMLAVGLKSFIVAIVGVITPFALGYYVSGVLMPNIDQMQQVYIGAILTATSVGITARVFKDLHFTQSIEARIVLGAAVIDDVLGLIILAVVAGLAQSDINTTQVTLISAKAIGFVVIAVAVGAMLARRTVKLFSAFNIPGLMLTIALALCFMGAYLADQAGLAAIVGAFCVGLVLDEVHFKSFQGERSIHDYIRPIAIFFVPIFFVLTGMKVKLEVFTDLSVLSVALAITAVAILGKLVCGWCFSSSTPINRLIIGVGMIPRGEVGLIFATVGKAIGVVNDEIYAITVIMVILSTLIPPPILSWLIKRSDRVAG